jgi:uncharacterized RDD family membrane protein YckC
MECIIFNGEDYGGYWRRTFADFFDAIILSILGLIISPFSTFIIVRMLGLESISHKQAAVFVIQILLFSAYMIGFKFYEGTTPGYASLKIKIISIDGGKASFAQIVVRLISSIFSVLCLGLGFIWIAFDKKKQAWHDKVAGTYVIRKNAEMSNSIVIPRTKLVNYKIFALMSFAIFFMIIGLLSGTTHMVRSSDAYKLSLQFIRQSSSIQEIAGEQLRFGRFPGGEFNFGGSGSAFLQINVFGEKGEIYVCPSLMKRDGQWMIYHVLILDNNGIPIDQITTEYVSGK